MQKAMQMKRQRTHPHRRSRHVTGLRLLAAAVVATVKPLADNDIDLWGRGLNKTTSVRDMVVTGGLTVRIKYLAP